MSRYSGSDRRNNEYLCQSADESFRFSLQPHESAAISAAKLTPSNFVMPAGSGCAGEIARYRAVQDNDLAMGHVAKSVYNQIKGEIADAEQVCAAGKDGEARAMITASRKRHGYPTDL